jgi:hypothetical protein
MNTPRNPVGWFEIYVQDMDRAKSFYESVFQIQLGALPSPDPDLECGSSPAWAVRANPAAPVPYAR